VLCLTLVCRNPNVPPMPDFDFPEEKPKKKGLFSRFKK